MTVIISGVFAAIVILIVSLALTNYFQLRLTGALTLVAIAFIYVGFSLQAATVGRIILECSVALMFFILAAIGYARRPVLIAYGIILHGLWDIVHHALILNTAVPTYWPSFCFTIDIIDGLFFIYFLSAKKFVHINS